MRNNWYLSEKVQNNGLEFKGWNQTTWVQIQACNLLAIDSKKWVIVFGTYYFFVK